MLESIEDWTLWASPSDRAVERSGLPASRSSWRVRKVDGGGPRFLDRGETAPRLETRDKLAERVRFLDRLRPELCLVKGGRVYVVLALAARFFSLPEDEDDELMAPRSRLLDRSRFVLGTAVVARSLLPTERPLDAARDVAMGAGMEERRPTERPRRVGGFMAVSSGLEAMERPRLLDRALLRGLDLLLPRLGARWLLVLPRLFVPPFGSGGVLLLRSSLAFFMRATCEGTLLLLLELEESVQVPLVWFPVLLSRFAVDALITCKGTGGNTSWMRLLLRAGRDFADGLSQLFACALMLREDRCLLELLVIAFVPGDDHRLRETDRALPRLGEVFSLRVGGAMGTTDSPADTGALIHDRPVPRCRAD